MLFSYIVRLNFVKMPLLRQSGRGVQKVVDDDPQTCLD